jgi:hypothetical protein
LNEETVQKRFPSGRADFRLFTVLCGRSRRPFPPTSETAGDGSAINGDKKAILPCLPPRVEKNNTRQGPIFVCPDARYEGYANAIFPVRRERLGRPAQQETQTDAPRERLPENTADAPSIGRPARRTFRRTRQEGAGPKPSGMLASWSVSFQTAPR